MMHYEQERQYVPMKQDEMKRRADNYRLARLARPKSRAATFRFYYGALANLGRWLVVSGTRLQRRYGQLAELPQHPPKQHMNYKRQM